MLPRSELQPVQAIPALSAILHWQKSQAIISDCLAEVMSWFTLVLEIFPLLFARSTSAGFVLLLVDLFLQVAGDFFPDLFLLILPLVFQILELFADLLFAFRVRAL